MISRFPRRASKPRLDPASLFDRLKTLWEQVVVFSALAYALGYLSRAIHALENSFGALPGARFDYLVAGLFLSIPVALLAGLMWALGAGVRACRPRFIKYPKASALVNEKMLPGALLVALVAFLGVIFLPPGTLPERAETVVLLVFFSLVALEILSSNSAVKSPLFRACFVVPLVGLFIAAALSGSMLLARWPQELGGVRPKCGVLDLAVDQLSPDLARLLVLPQASAPSASAVPAIARSHRLEVYSTSGPWLIQWPDPSASEAKGRSIRLAEQAVRSAEWFAPDTPFADASRACPHDPG